ncbi:acetylserotonin O-methyltransferase-like [Spea bombifrons]|uniref:acetylserotonin O-methyltransferase-like n=1 Tax=Spea bombifrons TaxID=233779 RepID=UPI00234B2952|nr:acetylserotonin O-methyltransferase-like [Spea bombifrons]
MDSFSEQEGVRLLQKYAFSFLTSQAMFAACDLKLFDVLAESEEPLSAAAIAESLGTSSRGTDCLLDVCVGLKLLDLDIQNGEVLYKNTVLSENYLTTTSSKSVCDAFKFYTNDVYPAAAHLKDVIKLGNPLCHVQSGLPPNEFFKDIYRSEENIKIFLKLMDFGWTSFAKKAVFSAFELSSFKTICDLGGGSGTLAKYCASLFPSSSIILYDLPEVIQATMENFVSPEDDRIIFQKGNFFSDPLPNAELFIVSRVLHDWDEESCLKLLGKMYMACNPGGGVLVIETILNEDKTASLMSHLQNIAILLLTEGKERTASEYKRLLETAGFKNIQFCTNGDLMEGILARK